MEVLDLFSAAAGGWSLGMHRAGFRTIAACEAIDWRRALYAENNPNVPIYEDVRGLTADRLRRDLGRLPSVVVGSPPCQDISSANTKGKGVEGERSGLYFEAVRIIGEVRPRWFALENSSNLRTRGADAVLAALEGLGYACWAFVVRASDIGANHERPRSWIIGCDLSQVADADRWQQWKQPKHGGRGSRWTEQTECEDDDQSGAAASNSDGFGWHEGRQGRRGGLDLSIPQDISHASQDGRGQGLSRGRAEPVERLPLEACGDARHADRERGTEGISASPDEGRDALGSGRLRSDADDQRGDTFSRETCASDTNCDTLRLTELSERSGPQEAVAGNDALDSSCIGHESGRTRRHGPERDGSAPVAEGAGSTANADQAGQPDGPMEPGLRQAQVPDDGCGSGRSADGQGSGEMGLCDADRIATFERRPDWSLDDLADHIRLDAGLSRWVAEQRIAVGGPRGTSAASLIVEAYGDSVVPQIPESIGRAMLRVEAALAAVYGRTAA